MTINGVNGVMAANTMRNGYQLAYQLKASKHVNIQWLMKVKAANGSCAIINTMSAVNQL